VRATLAARRGGDDLANRAAKAPCQCSIRG
jgi:hypothetical protein